MPPQALFLLWTSTRELSSCSFLPHPQLYRAKEGDAGERRASPTCSSAGHPHRGCCSDPTTLDLASETSLGMRADSHSSISNIHVLFLEMMAARRPSRDQYKQASCSMGCTIHAPSFSALKAKSKCRMERRRPLGEIPSAWCFICSARHQNSPGIFLRSVDFGGFP